MASCATVSRSVNRLPPRASSSDSIRKTKAYKASGTRGRPSKAGLSGKNLVAANMEAGRPRVGRTKSFDPAPFDSQISAEVKGFDPALYLTPKEIKRTERFTQFAVAAAKQAVADAGVRVEQEDPFRFGAIIGSGIPSRPSSPAPTASATSGMVIAGGDSWA